MNTIDALKAKVPSMADPEFAKSLIAQWEKKGYLSDKQMWWVAKLAGAKEDAKLSGSLAPLVALFTKARAHLKAPKVVIEIAGATYGFSLAKDGSPNAGHLYVKRGGEYLGKVTPGGEFKRVFACSDADVAAVDAFSEDPAGLAAKHGQLRGKCCFCNRGLKDKRSTEVGYGPDCADHYGLAWG